MTYNITTITITIVCTKWIIEELPLLKREQKNNRKSERDCSMFMLKNTRMNRP